MVYMSISKLKLNLIHYRGDAQKKKMMMMRKSRHI